MKNDFARARIRHSPVPRFHGESRFSLSDFTVNRLIRL